MTGSYPALPHDIHHRIEDLYVYSIPPPNYDKKGGQELLLQDKSPQHVSPDSWQPFTKLPCVVININKSQKPLITLISQINFCQCPFCWCAYFLKADLTVQQLRALCVSRANLINHHHHHHHRRRHHHHHHHLLYKVLFHNDKSGIE